MQYKIVIRRVRDPAGGTEMRDGAAVNTPELLPDALNAAADNGWVVRAVVALDASGTLLAILER